jgi:hypothetical protein
LDIAVTLNLEHFTTALRRDAFFEITLSGYKVQRKREQSTSVQEDFINELDSNLRETNGTVQAMSIRQPTWKRVKAGA